MVSVKFRDLIPSWADLRPRPGDDARHRPRLHARVSAGRRRGPVAVHRLRGREEDPARPSRFGNGAIEGVAAPEAANNAGAQTSFIPLLTLGIPANALMALMIGALMMQGIQPGPQIMKEQPQLVWGVIASMWTGNLMLLVINLPLVGIWVSMLKIPYRLLFPAIALLCCVGTYAIANSVFNIWLDAGCALIGFFFIKVGAEPAPLLLGLVLGPQLEENFRRAMLLSAVISVVFVQQPISAVLLALAALLILVLPGCPPPARMLRNDRRSTAFSSNPAVAASIASPSRSTIVSTIAASTMNGGANSTWSPLTPSTVPAHRSRPDEAAPSSPRASAGGGTFSVGSNGCLLYAIRHQLERLEQSATAYIADEGMTPERSLQPARKIRHPVSHVGKPGHRAGSPAAPQARRAGRSAWPI